MNAPIVTTRTGLLGVLLAGVVAKAGIAWGDEPVQVRLASGREFTGFIDPRTDTDTLWLRFEGPGSRLLRPVRWDAVQRLSAGGRDFRGKELAGAWPGLKAQEAPLPLVHPNPPPDVALEHLLPDHGGDLPPPRIVALRVEARLAHWDRDPESDGVVVQVYPLDSWGLVAPCEGTLELRLVGEDRGPIPLIRMPFPRSSENRELGRWVRRLSGPELTPVGYLARCEFQGSHPEVMGEWGAQAVLHARLSVPGQGVFEATSEAFRVRESNPLRDRRQLRGESRFFGFENLGLAPW